jgi:hypothetical protein
MSTLNFFMPGWTALPVLIPTEIPLEEPPISDSSDWSPEASDEGAEERYTNYCDRKYDVATQELA